MATNDHQFREQDHFGAYGLHAPASMNDGGGVVDYDNDDVM